MFSEMQNTLQKVIDLLADEKNAQYYDYQEATFSFGFGLGNWEVYYMDNHGEDVQYVEADNYEEAIGMFCINNPDIPFSQIIYAEEVQKYGKTWRFI